MTEARDPWVTLNVTLDVPGIEAQVRAAMSDLELAGKAFVERMAMLGFPAMVIIDVSRDPR